MKILSITLLPGLYIAANIAAASYMVFETIFPAVKYYEPDNQQR